MNATTCPEDHELLAVATGEEASSEVRSHLDTCADCRQRLQQLRAEVSNLRAALGDMKLSSPSLDDPAATTPPQPATIGKYLVLDVLGRGGQADVYRALHAALGKEVVIKLSRQALQPGRADRDRLLAEGKVLADLDHPHLARVYDLDEHEGHPFLVMEYVRGRTLRQHAEEQRPTPRQAARLVAQLARALAVAHRRGVVHQDLKPKNILIDEAGQPRVIDFGMARLVHGWVDDRGQPEGGTVAYMAPEQARGETGRINPRSDIFALGAVLYFLLVGQPPFRGRDRLEELERAEHCQFDREALRMAKVPRRVEAICLRAMAPEPSDRYARAEDLAVDLERFLRRPRQLALVAGIAIVGLLAWPAWKAWESRPVLDHPQPQPEIRLPKDALSVRLFRDKKPRELKTASDWGIAPLRTGDELKVEIPVPPELHASLFWIDSKGNIEHLVDAGPGEPLSYPLGSGVFKELVGPSGTEMVLACWRRSGPISVEEVRRLWGPAEPWPELPKESVLHLDRDEVKSWQKGRRLGPSRSHPDPEGDVRAQLERLRRRLCDSVDFLEGVAFLHKDGPSSP